MGNILKNAHPTWCRTIILNELVVRHRRRPVAAQRWIKSEACFFLVRIMILMPAGAVQDEARQVYRGISGWHSDESNANIWRAGTSNNPCKFSLHHVNF
jgi:hypothetical protein